MASSAKDNKKGVPFRLMRRSSMIVADTGERIRASLGTKPKPNRALPMELIDEGNGDVWLSRTSEDLDESSPLIEDVNARVPPWRSWSSETLEFLTSRSFKNVLKCSLAYFIGSLAVYTPIGTWLYGHSDNKHMIATVSVYFHPARTAGGMTEAILFAALSLVFSLVMALSSMAVSAVFYNLDLVYVGYLIDLIVFLGGGLGSIAFLKQKINKPSFNQACSLASIFLVTILTKEGNVQEGSMSLARLLQSFMFVLSGVVLSTTISYFLWPESAILKLKESLNKSMDFQSSLLTFLSSKFINGEDVHNAEFEKLNSDLTSCYRSLESNLSEAKLELFFSGRESEYYLLRQLVESSHSLTLTLGGLSSSAKIQSHLLYDDSDTESTQSNSANSVVSFDEDFVAQMHHSHQTLEENTNNTSGEDNLAKSLFKVFVLHLGPPMVSFYTTIKDILDDLPFEHGSDYPVSLNPQYKSSLSLATELYSIAREKALDEVYSQDVFQKADVVDDVADQEGVAAMCGNFSYVLEDFGRELTVFVNVLEEYKRILDAHLPRSYNWAKFWSNQQPPFFEAEVVNRQPVFKSPVELLNQLGTIGGTHKQEKPHLGLRLWRRLRAFRRSDVQFGFKVGVGAIIFAIPAFAPSLRPTFSRWRGEWGLITYAIIMNRYEGGTTMTIPIRFVGTFLGAAIAYVAWALFPGNQYVLGFLGFAMALGCFHIILNWGSKNPFGRFILLTYNLTALYSYSLSVYDDDNDDDEGGTNPIVGDIAFHRFVSVFVGVLWAVFMVTVIMPTSARRTLRNVLCVQWFRMGLIWRADCLQTIPRKSSADEPRFSGIQGEHDLQRTMVHLQSLLTHAPNEWRLKGQFPVEKYKEIVHATQRILDGFQNIGVLVAKYPKPSSHELELIQHTNSERRELCSRIFLFFYLVSAAMKLGFPLPDKLPSTTHAIDRMLLKLSDFRSKWLHDEEQGNEELDEEDFVLFYSYILVTVTITEELSKIAICIQELFGTIEQEMLTVA